MAEIKTTSGFKAKILDEATDNWELLKAFREIDRGNTGAIVDVAPLLLGEEQAKALEEHLRNKNGVVRATDMVNEITEIMQGANTTKKS